MELSDHYNALQYHLYRLSEEEAEAVQLQYPDLLFPTAATLFAAFWLNALFVN